MLSLMMARILVKTFSKTYGMFPNTKAIENRVRINQLRLKRLSPLTKEFRRVSKETRELLKYRAAIMVVMKDKEIQARQLEVRREQDKTAP